jgi:hypothetical protein
MSQNTLSDGDRTNIFRISLRAARAVSDNAGEKGLALLAAEVLISSLNWDNTPEGHAYWADVYNKIRAIAGEPPEFKVDGDKATPIEPNDEEEHEDTKVSEAA